MVDKPGGMTSHDVVSRVRRLARTRRVGHGGTLDPMATGVLVIGVGRATRLLTYVIGSDKRYAATIRLGQATVTDDAEGDVVVTAPSRASPTRRSAPGWRRRPATISQVPSAVSAIKVDGKRAYKMVRDGESVELAARTVTVSPAGCARHPARRPTWTLSTWMSTWRARPARISGRSPATSVPRSASAGT